MAVSVFDALPWKIGHAVDRSLRPTEEDNSVNVEKNECCEKLVILLGWGGALQKHLSRMRQFYLSEGFAVVSYISPMSCFLGGGLIETDIDQLAQTTQQELAQVRQKTFHVHLHSNNGTVVWGALMLSFKESRPEVLAALDGIVFDSAPRMDPKPPSLVYQAFGFTFPCIPIMLRKNQYIHPIWTPVLFVYFLQKLLVLHFTLPAARRFAFTKVREAVLYGMPTNVPQLFVYSAKDKLISQSAVEAYILAQKKRGVTIHTKLFIDTPHVQHFLRKDAEYKEALNSFLKSL